jgi:acyl dehydratase
MADGGYTNALDGSVILDEDIEKAKRLVGADTALNSLEHISVANVDAIRNFAHGYGDDNPLYTDPAYATTTRWGGLIAPNIMAAVVNRPMLGDKLPDELRALKKGLFRGIHVFVSGSDWTWYQPVREGDSLMSFAGEDGVEVKASEYAGRTVTKFLRTVKINQRGEVVGVYRKRSILSERKAAKEKGKYTTIEPASYTEDDIRKLDEIYRAEKARGAEKRYFEDVTVGELMGTMAKGPLTVTDMIIFHAGGYGFQPYALTTGRMWVENRGRIPAFYAPNGQGVPDVMQRVHWDKELAQATTGNPLPYDYGVQRECWLHHFLTDWAGNDGWVERQYDEVRRFNYLGDSQIITGEVTGKRIESDRPLIDVEIRATSQRGEVTARCSATIALPSREFGPALLPEVDTALKRRATEMFERHMELTRAGGR